MLWINFLHIYQPANTDAHIVKEATEKSYFRMVKALESRPNIKFTLNITGCLVLRWQELGYEDLISRFKNLINRGQIEITGSAAYHPVLSLVPEKEARIQIEENEKILKKYFGDNLKLKGFFLPEMIYSPEVAKLVKKLGYEWLVLDEIAYGGKLNQVDFDKIYKDKHSGLDIVFRSRSLSKSYVPDKLQQIIKEGKDNDLFITATDGELYGLRHDDPTGVFENLLNYKNLDTLTISEFISRQEARENIKLLLSSWETTEIELAAGQPYILWQDKNNKIQKKLWKLAELAQKTLEKYKNDANYNWARWHLVRGLASCTFWWASGKDFRLFGPISWSPDEIERGANELIRAIRALDDASTRKTKIRAEKLYIKIKKMIWQKHWNEYWKKT